MQVALDLLSRMSPSQKSASKCAGSSSANVIWAQRVAANGQSGSGSTGESTAAACRSGSVCIAPPKSPLGLMQKLSDKNARLARADASLFVMKYRGHELSANVSMLFTELPYAERFAAAAQAGFRVVESWWPFAVPDPSVSEIDDFVRTVSAAGVSLGALNFYGGDIPGGERGVASHPDRQEQLAANVQAVVRIADRTGCQLFNLLYGQLDDRWSPDEQAKTAAAAIRSAASAVAAVGGTVLIEPLTEGLNGRYPLLTADDVLRLLNGPLHDVGNLSLLFDTFHLGSNGVDLLATASSVPVAHVQLADSPGRGEPGSGALPIDATLDALKAAGYEGVAACEYKPTRDTLSSLEWIS
jgi:hydroxypyruvate isomerase